jgi:hypothetical protein
VQEWTLQRENNSTHTFKIAPNQIGLLSSGDGLQVQFVTPDETYPVISIVPAHDQVPEVWHLMTRSGFIGETPVRLANLFEMESATDSDVPLSELIEIESLVFNQDHRITTLKTKDSLKNRYDGASVTLYGNVVSATHGQRVPDESLGDSDGLGVNHSFALKQAPLTYLAPTGDGEAESTLEIFINGIKWKSKKHLNGSRRDERVYMVRQDAKNNSTVIFGDGQQGSGIPSGTREITASYRQGLGEEGNVPAGSLRLMQTSLPGVKGVSNPVPAEKGADADKVEDVRQLAPLTVCDFGRIVSLRDYTDFARHYPRIVKAQAFRDDAGAAKGDARRPVKIYVAPQGGSVIAPDSDLLTSLRAAIDACRASPVPPFTIDSYAPVLFNVDVTIYYDREQEKRKEQIKAAARRLLEDTFAFARRDFRQAVYVSEIVTPLQNIPGVRAAKVDSLYRFNVRNKAARLVGPPDELRPQEDPEILIINTVDGIKLELEAAQ